MMGFIKLYTDIDKPVFINPAHIVKIEEQGYPPRTLISTVDDTCTAVVEKPYEVLDKIYREGREQWQKWLLSENPKSLQKKP